MKQSLFGLFLLLGLTKFYGQNESYTLETENLPEGVIKTVTTRLGFNSKSKGHTLKNYVVITDTYNDTGGLVKRETQNYDNDGNYDYTTSKTWSYNSSGKVVYHDYNESYYIGDEYFYNPEGNLIRIETLFASKNRFRAEYEYDTNNKLIKILKYNHKGQLSFKYEFTYNRNRKIVVKTNYDTNTEVVEETTTRYFKNNLLVEEKMKSRNNSERRYTYEYDFNDNLINRISQHDDGYNSRYYSYKYDNQGNWIAKLSKKHDYYFYFRKIYFNDGSESGSSSIDKSFVSSKVDISEFDFLNKVEQPDFKQKTFTYNYVSINQRNISSSGSFKITASGIGNINEASQAFIKIKLGDESFEGGYFIDANNTSSDSYNYTFESMLEDLTIKLKLLKIPTTYKSKRIIGYIYIDIDGSTQKYFLE